MTLRRIFLEIIISLTLVLGCNGCGGGGRRRRPDPVHGSWSDWEPSVGSCCDGTVRHDRYCNNPPPNHGGNLCNGMRHEMQILDCNECSCSNGGCDHTCSNYFGSYQCSCNDGYRKDGKRCKESRCKTDNWPSPANGKKTTSECQNGNTVSLGTQCTVECLGGYTMIGAKSTTCGSYGLWNPSNPPNCKAITCSSITVQDNMAVNPAQCTSNPTGGTTCTISCKNGFSLMRYSSSVHETTCSGGSWTKGSSFYCRDLVKPVFTSCQHEDISVTADKMKTKATVTWKAIKAKDNDGSLPAMSVYPNYLQPGATSFEFSEGNHYIVFTARDKSGNTKQCSFKISVKVIRCPTVSAPSNGKTIPSVCTRLLGSKCNSECNDGYNLTGSAGERECVRKGSLDDGKWTGVDSTCEKIKCPFLPEPNHTKRTGLGCSVPNPEFRTLCTFECLPGYKAKAGSKTRACKADGQWSGDELQCQIVTCPTLAKLSEGLSISNSKCIQSTSIYKDVCRYSCGTGYLLLGPATKSCSTTGQWSPAGNAYCKDISMPSFIGCPSTIKTFADKHSRSVKVSWTTPSVKDNAPDKPVVIHQGKSPGDEFKAGHHSIKYIATDKAGNTAQCLFQVIVEVIKCPALPSPLRGSIKCSLDNVYGSQCQLECNIGYALKGSAVRTCEKNVNQLLGQWTGNTTVCKAITCAGLDSPRHGYKSSCLTNSFGEKCLFYCNIGYEAINGSTSRTCLENATWSGTPLFCKATHCPALFPTSRVSIVPSTCSNSPTYQVTCQYLCPAGYRLKGLSIKTCLANGQWNHNSNVSCQDVERPRFTVSCPHNIEVFARKNMDSAVVMLSSMNATDNSREVPTIKVTGQKHNYTTGRHEITITAMDASGNKETCRFFIYVKILRCFSHPSYITNGRAVSICGNTWGSACHFKCNNGYNMTGSSTRICEVISGQIQGYWSGIMPFCTINRCRPLNTPNNGYVYPPMCVSSQGPVSDTSCLFGCYNGFVQSSGTPTITCGKDARWDKNVSTIITCIDKTPPQFTHSCPLDIRVSLGHDGLARANWTIPVAEDNTNVLPTLTVQPFNAIPPFSVNKSTVVTYTAKDQAGNVGRCSFRIIVEDNVGPRVVYCPPNITKVAIQLAETVTWKTPEFVDNSNVKVVPKCNRQSGTKFYWGIWNIHCRGYDNNPNNPPAVCSFRVTVSPKPCPALNPPQNGAKSCAIWMLGLICTPSCNDQFDFAYQIPFGTMWVCGSKGSWMPSNQLPDCSEIYVPGSARKAASLLYYFSGNCNNATVQEQIKRQFIEIIKTSPLFNEICTDPQLIDKCNVSNVAVECGMRVVPVGRKRRSVASDTMRIKFDIYVHLKDGTNKTKQQIQAEVVNASQTLDEIASEIQKMANNGSLVLNVTDQSISPINGSFSASETTFTCGSGQIFVDKKCISCPVGTYHNASLQQCLHCPKGWYQDAEGQQSCTLCPVGMSTMKDKSKNRTDCIAYCRPGSSSPTGFEPCIQCDKGTFQSFPGQLSCTRCSNSTTTQTTGATSPGKCLVPCKPGSFSSTGLEPCRQCDKRSYQPSSEAKSCFKCPGTTIVSNQGSVNALDCKEINECNSNPCRVGSTCIDLVGDFACLCQTGYTGKQCEYDVNDCASHPCQNNATCHDKFNGFNCTCLAGFTGSECETEINECEQTPCLNNATCRDLIGRYECYCQPGYDGVRCEKEINECAPNPCLNGGTCHDKVNAFSCQCVQGFRGPTCQDNIDDCSPNPCKNGGQCKDAINSYSCTCPKGSTGIDCEKDIDECLSSPCTNNGTCYNKVGDFSCVCMNGYNGSTCEQEVNECLSVPCGNGGTCKNTVGAFSCRCVTGFQGDYCEKDVDECASQPCTNNATCTNTVGSFSCNCVPGFTGQTCETDIDECLSNPCANNGSCENVRNGFICDCLDGFSGSHCQVNIDECVGSPCKNNATCSDGINEYQCSCNAGFIGEDCEITINHCASNPCENSGQCHNLPTDYKCSCIKGYIGKNCSHDVNDCLNNPCRNNGQCEDLVGAYRCSCLPGYTGINCSHNIDDCIAHGCLNNGTCVDDINTYHCICQQGFTGKYCEVSVRPCDSFPCHNSGNCSEKDDQKYACSCPEGFKGQNCQENINDCKPTNPCQNNGTCTDLVSNYSCSCSQGIFGRHCENVTDYCSSANCSQHGNCVNLPFGFRCKCSDGFYGPTCDLLVKKCISSPCKNGGTCHETSEGFNCSCTTGFTGKTCDMNIDDCQDNKCLNNATCIDQVNNYMCLCYDGFNGTYCQQQLYSCEDKPCENNGTCQDIFGGYTCRCPERYGGPRCDKDKSPCIVNPCLNGGLCTELNLTLFNCTCKTGFTGFSCETNIDDCASSPCPLHSNCIDQLNSFSCKCHQSHTGRNCETPLGDNFDLVFKTKAKDNVVEPTGTTVPDMKSFTIALWVKPDIRYHRGTIITYMVPGNPSEMMEISFTDTFIRVVVKTDALQNSANITDGKWHFIGFTWNRYGNEFSIYLDGKIIRTSPLLSGPPLKGGGKIVLGQKYSWQTKTYVASDSFVGILHQVNVWYMAQADQEYMWNAAHSCSWPIEGNIYSWIAFMSGVKGNVLKKFPSACKALDLCKKNCSHYVECHKKGDEMICSCQKGFTGKLCDTNINDCISNPCIHGRCMDDIASYRCDCNKGYYGNNCENKLQADHKECPALGKLRNGKIMKESYAGKHVADLKCNERYSFRVHDVTRYACGPQTDWKWNNLDKLTLPRCLSTAEPLAIRRAYSMVIPIDPVSCQTQQGYLQLKTSFKQAFIKSIENLDHHGCFVYGPCKVERLHAPKCLSRRASRSIKQDLNIEFGLMFSEWGNSSYYSTVTEIAEAVSFQVKYAVTVGTFVMVFNGQQVKPRGTSFKLISHSHQCKEGYVNSNDNASCVACPTGTYQSSVDCLSCPLGQYQDTEGRMTCKKCRSDYSTNAKGSTDKERCSKLTREGVTTWKIVVPVVLVVIIIALIVAFYIWKKRDDNLKVTRTKTTSTFNGGLPMIPIRKNSTDEEAVYDEIKDLEIKAIIQSSKINGKSISTNTIKNSYEDTKGKENQLFQNKINPCEIESTTKCAANAQDHTYQPLLKNTKHYEVPTSRHYENASIKDNQPLTKDEAKPHYENAHYENSDGDDKKPTNSHDNSGFRLDNPSYHDINV